MPVLTLRCAGRTETGRRANNEDTLLATSRLAAVADGVGGAVAGEVASATIITALALLDKSLLAVPLDVALPEAIVRGNATLRFVAECRPELAGMSTTLTVVALTDDGDYLVANVGDSRSYLYRDGALRQLTRDDSLIQALLDRGAITAEQAASHPQRSVVLDALDGRARDTVATHALAAQAGDRLLLCSDGLSDALDGDQLAAGLAEPDARVAAGRLIDDALAAGARDNVSVVIADVVAAPAGTPGWRPAPALSP